MNDIVNIEATPTAIIGNLSRKEIKDKAADMVVGLDSDDIKSYNPESSRKNRILNRVYNRYNKKYNDEKFTSLSLREINKLPTKEQERWFALNKSKTAGPVLSGMLAATSIPMTLGGLVTAGSTVPTLLSLAGGFGGSYVGSKIGEEYDKNRHGLSNNTLAGSLVGGTAGGFIGGISGAILQRKLPIYIAAKQLLKNIDGTPAPRNVSYVNKLTATNKRVHPKIQNFLTDKSGAIKPHNVGGAESDVFFDPDHNVVYKLSRPHKTKHFEIANYMLDKGNIGPLSLESTYEGVLQTTDGPRVVISQPMVKPFKNLGDFSDLYTWLKLKTNGYKRVGPGTYKYGDYVFRDVKGANVGIKDGRFVIFDPEIINSPLFKYK